MKSSNKITNAFLVDSFIGLSVDLSAPPGVTIGRNAVVTVGVVRSMLVSRVTMRLLLAVLAMRSKMLSVSFLPAVAVGKIRVVKKVSISARATVMAFSAFAASISGCR